MKYKKKIESYTIILYKMYNMCNKYMPKNKASQI